MGLIADLLHTYQWRVSCWIRNLETNHNILARGNRWVRRCGPSQFLFLFCITFGWLTTHLQGGSGAEDASRQRPGGLCDSSRLAMNILLVHALQHYIGAAFFGNVARPCGEVCKASGSVAQSCVAELWWSTCFSKTRCIAAVPRMLVPKANTIKVAQGMHGTGS